MLQKIHPVLVLPSATGCHFQVMFTQFGENANKQQKQPVFAHAAGFYAELLIHSWLKSVFYSDTVLHCIIKPILGIFVPDDFATNNHTGNLQYCAC